MAQDKKKQDPGNVAVANPFGISARAEEETAMAHTDSQRAIAEVQAAMILARSNRRNQKDAMDRVLDACTRVSLAEKATYDYSRGGTAITGPSIRLAEVMAANWGNMQYGVREVSQAHGESVVQAYAWDLETNTKSERTFTVKHLRSARGGTTKLTDPRDVYENNANQGARRLRSCLLAVMPGDVAEAAVAQCELTLKSKVDCSPDAIKRMVEAFGKHGVTKAQIEARLQRRVESITPAQLVQLGKIHTSLGDSMSVVGDWFKAAEPEGSRTDNLADQLEDEVPPAQPFPAEDDAPPPEPPEDEPPPVAAEEIPLRDLAPEPEPEPPTELPPEEDDGLPTPEQEEAFTMGRAAADAGDTIKLNPYNDMGQKTEYLAWRAGWKAFHQEVLDAE